MRDMREEKPSSLTAQDIFTKGDILSKEAVELMGTYDQNAQIRRNELLLKIQDQSIEVNRKLKDVDALQNRLKQHLKYLKQLQKMLSK